MKYYLLCGIYDTTPKVMLLFALVSGWTSYRREENNFIVTLLGMVASD